MRKLFRIPLKLAVIMFLFNKDLHEDYMYMLNGYKNGILSEKRLDEAVTRILAAKAAIGLHKKAKTELVPAKEDLSILRMMFTKAGHMSAQINLSHW